MSDTLNATKRDETGTLRMRRLRRTGHIPAVLYGGGGDSIALTLKTSEVNAALRHNARVVQLAGDVSESAFIKKVQWDQLGSDVLHLDLSRIDASEKLEVKIKVELRGIAPGSKQGGIVNQVLHNVMISCSADKLPERFSLSVNTLELDQTLTAGDIELSEGVELLTPKDELIATCVEAKVAEEEEPADFSAEPEVIGAKDDEDGGGENN